jgi:hypothetical protein
MNLFLGLQTLKGRKWEKWDNHQIAIFDFNKYQEV